MTPLVVPIGTLRRAGMPDAGVDRLRADAVTSDDASLTFDTESDAFARRRALLGACGVRVPVPMPDDPVAAAVPPADWPAWARAVAAMRAPGDAGVGSTIQRLLGASGVAAKAILAAAGVQCGCDARRAAWDELYGYGDFDAAADAGD